MDKNPSIAPSGAQPQLELHQTGFMFLQAEATRRWLEAFGPLADWDAFAGSWNGMPLDNYMADGGRYRRRRHAVFAATAGKAEIVRAAHKPHFQGLDYNKLNGGIERWFEPVTDAVANGGCMRVILQACRSLFDGSSLQDSWHIEAHQFRIEARADSVGQPTPEGMHRDGVDFVLVLLIARQNILSGTTTIYGLDKKELGSFTLTQPLDAALVDDRRVYHGVTAVRPEDIGREAFRDVLVATFRKIHD